MHPANRSVRRPVRNMFYTSQTLHSRHTNPRTVTVHMMDTSTKLLRSCDYAFSHRNLKLCSSRCWSVHLARHLFRATSTISPALQKQKPGKTCIKPIFREVSDASPWHLADHMHGSRCANVVVSQTCFFADGWTSQPRPE
jgi:hypothetical protein